MQTLALPKPAFAFNSPLGFGTFSSAYLIKKKSHGERDMDQTTHSLQHSH